MLSLRAMLHLELPHVNVLSKVDLIAQYGELGQFFPLGSVIHPLITLSDFSLDFYTEVQDLSYLENALTSTSPRFKELNMAICSLIEDFGLVGFETLAVEVRTKHPPLPMLYSSSLNFAGQGVYATSGTNDRQSDWLCLRPTRQLPSTSRGRRRHLCSTYPTTQCVQSYVKRDGPRTRSQKRREGRSGAVDRRERGVRCVGEGAVEEGGTCGAGGGEEEEPDTAAGRA